MTEAVLDINNLTKHYNGVTVLKGISTHAKAGQVIGLVGLNGAGKTTLLETALGFTLPDEGATEVFNVPSARLGAHPNRAKIGFVPQQDELLGSYTGVAYLDLISEFYPNWDSATTQRLIHEWQVPMDRSINKLSLGERQKLSIISALGHQPDFIVLDEPVASLDPLARRKFLLEIVNLAADRGATVIFSTHIVTDLERVAERIWLLKNGELIVDEPLDELKEKHPTSLEGFFLELHQ
ncbi:MAG: ATP-binding cassette domain-containing protein [Pseudomonadales bacterium]|nr:ATP-binding cassette domain-containing protein [Pseudomonadales bacterium]